MTKAERLQHGALVLARRIAGLSLLLDRGLAQVERLRHAMHGSRRVMPRQQCAKLGRALRV